MFTVPAPTFVTEVSRGRLVCPRATDPESSFGGERLTAVAYPVMAMFCVTP
jgi:hypothetical protein